MKADHSRFLSQALMCIIVKVIISMQFLHLPIKCAQYDKPNKREIQVALMLI